MAELEALLDSNVIIAMVAEDHEHHEASAALLARGDGTRFRVAALSYTAAYATLTRRGPTAPFRYMGAHDAPAAKTRQLLEDRARASIVANQNGWQRPVGIRSYAMSRASSLSPNALTCPCAQ